MEQFITWEMLKTYTSFVAIVYMVVEFTKGLPLIKKMPTKYWSFIITFILLTFVNIASNEFSSMDLVLYALSGVSISLGANGLSNFNDKNTENKTK